MTVHAFVTSDLAQKNKKSGIVMIGVSEDAGSNTEMVWRQLTANNEIVKWRQIDAYGSGI
jgi:hypothetical protein